MTSTRQLQSAATDGDGYGGHTEFAVFQLLIWQHFDGVNAVSVNYGDGDISFYS
jgi:hypothetical protein